MALLCFCKSLNVCFNWRYLASHVRSYVQLVLIMCLVAIEKRK